MVMYILINSDCCSVKSTLRWDGDCYTDLPVCYIFHMQCRGGVGVCPDTLDSRGTCADNVTVVSGYSFNRKQCVSFIRPFETGLLW